MTTPSWPPPSASTRPSYAGLRGDLDHHRLDHSANQALNAHPELVYALIETEGQLVLAESLVEKCLSATRWKAT